MKNYKPGITETEYSRESLERNRRHGEVTRSGVVFDGELAGPGGMSFVLLREPDTTDQMINDACIQLHQDRDVVGKIKVTAVIPYGDQSERPRG